MNKMIKRRKDDGFTLIELMIVIAVIGILAVVLVPKVGSIKTQAKMSGVDTNIRTVQAYVQSRITDWNSSSKASDAIVTEVDDALTGGTDPMKNPLDNTLSAFKVTGGAPAAEDKIAGEIYLVVTGTPVTNIDIVALDSGKDIYRTISVTP